MSQELDPLYQIWGRGGGCLAGDTLIWTPTGYQPISTIEVGQDVLCFTPDKEIVVSKVEKTFFHPQMEVYTYKFWGGEIAATPNHAFYTEKNSFKEIRNWEIDEFFIDANFEYRPLLDIYDHKVADVYNFMVEKYHTYIIHKVGILSSNGGGGKKKSPTEQKDTAKTSSRANVVEILSEGPIEGLVKGEQSIFFDKTPLGNEDDTKNFEGVTWAFVNGSQNQGFLPDTLEEGLTSETNVDIDVKKALPVTRSFVNPQVDAVRVRIGLQIQTYTDDGSILGGNIHFKIFLRQGAAGSFVEVLNEIKQNVRFSSLTEFEYQFPVDNQNGVTDQFFIRVERVTDDIEDSKQISVLRFQSFTEVINNAKIAYVNTACIDVQFLADQFGSVPQRAYEIGGRTVAIPTNAVVNTEDRGLDFNNAIWDGTLYEPPLATSDPAWQLYDLLTNERYGTGAQITPCQVSIYDLYEISRYNNELIPSGFGTTERRFRCNTVLQTKQSAHEFINAIMGNCRAQYYWDGSCIRFWQDRPTEITRQFTNSDVENGEFKYSSTDIQTRNSVCNVTWNDPDDYYRTTVESVELAEAIRKFGYRDTEFTDYGCTSRGQAYRSGRFSLLSGFYNTETITFRARAIGLYTRPGDVIAVSDWRRAKFRYGGLIVSATTTTVVLDDSVELPSATGYSITCTMPDLTLQTRVITNTSGSHNVINVAEPFTIAPTSESNWIIDVIQPRTYRVQSIKTETDNPDLIEVVAGSYREDLYEAAENGWTLEPVIRQSLTPSVPPVPTNPVITFTQLSTASNLDYILRGRWDAPTTDSQFVTGYLVQWKREVNGLWSESIVTTEREFTLSPVYAGTYYIRVSSLLIDGSTSRWATSGGAIAGSTSNLYFDFTRPRSMLVL